MVTAQADAVMLGREFLRVYLQRRSAPPLAWIVKDMMRGGHFGGVETGFVSALERAARDGAAVSSGFILQHQPDDLGLHNRVIRPHD